jgi:hypothetical protein
MTLHAPFVRTIPFLLFAGIALLSYLLNFNGLYGQDAYEYLRRSRGIFDWLHTGVALPQTVAATEFPMGYPLAGAVLRYLLRDATLSLQVISWLSYAGCVWVFERILNLLSHGSRPDSRWVFATLGLAFAPLFIRAGMTVMSDAMGLLLVLSALFFALRWMEMARQMDMLLAFLCMVLAVFTRFALLGMALPLFLAMLWQMAEKRKYSWLLASLGLSGAAICLNYFGAVTWLPNPATHSDVHWSLRHVFSRSFDFENGRLEYLLPNALHVFSPLMHYAFCLPLAGLLLLSKKTDVSLVSKKIILFCLSGYLLLLAGLSSQNLRFLLPAYALLLLLIFPAWDRMYCYGFYFFRKLAWSILAGVLIVQIIGTYLVVKEPLARNRLERQISEQIRPFLPPGSVVYAFDLDIALRSEYPECQWINLWESRIESFQDGALVLFNEPALRKQWEGRNPMLNWDALRAKHDLNRLISLPQGWQLFRIGDR